MYSMSDTTGVSTSNQAHSNGEREGLAGSKPCKVSSECAEEKAFCDSVNLSLGRPQSTASECARTPDDQACRYELPAL